MLAINKSLIFISNLLKSFELKGGGAEPKCSNRGGGNALLWGNSILNERSRNENDC